VIYCLQATPVSPAKIHHQVTQLCMVMTCQKCSMLQNYAASSTIDKWKAMVIPVHPAHQGCTWTQNERRTAFAALKESLYIWKSLTPKWGSEMVVNVTTWLISRQNCWTLVKKEQMHRRFISSVDKWWYCNEINELHATFWWLLTWVLWYREPYLLNILHITASYLEAEEKHCFRNRLLSLTTPDLLIALHL
jgi:hypothetical protein